MAYIERQYLTEQFEDLLHNDNIMNPVVKVLDALEIIDTAPAADVVEVVRCKDCKHLYCLSAIDRRFYCKHYPQGLSGINIVEDNPFCSYGERKESEVDTE